MLRTPCSIFPWLAATRFLGYVKPLHASMKAKGKLPRPLAASLPLPLPLPLLAALAEEMENIEQILS